MSPARSLSVAFAVSRIGYATALIVAPKRTGQGWLGVSAGSPPTQVALRGLAIRDLMFAVGVIAAARTGGAVRPWLAAQVVGDGADLTSTLLAASSLPPKARKGTIAVAGATGLAGIALLAAVDK